MALHYPYSKHCFDSQEIDNVKKVLSEGWIARGPKILEFEKSFSETLGYAHSICCTNGSAAIEIALRTLGVGPGDEVIVPTLSWASTATSVSMTGAIPIFADICLSNYCIDPKSIAANITSNTKAVIPVHFAGLSADMESIWTIAEEHGLSVIEDCAHALGGSYDLSSPIGSSSRSYASTFSLHPAKNITTAEGGIIVTANDETAERLRLYRSGGVKRQSEDNGLLKAFYDIQVISSNYHMTDIQASIGLAQLLKIKDFVDVRRQQAARYSENLSKSLLVSIHNHGVGSAANLYIVLINDETKRNDVFQHLNNQGIGAYYHYPLIHKSSIYKYSLHTQEFRCAEFYSERALTLPLGPHLAIEDIDYISRELLSALSDT